MGVDPIEIPWDLPSFRGSFTQVDEFTPFPRLPAEIRCKIWQAACTPRRFSSSPCDATRKWTRKGYRRVVAPLPATARVNQEARAETLRVYSKIPNTTSSWDISGFINYEVDTMTFSCYGPSYSARELPWAILQNLQRITIVPKCWVFGCQPTRTDLNTFDNFLCYVATRYFPKLRELDIDLSPQLERGGKSFLSAPRRAAPGMSCSFRPLFFRTVDGHGLQFLPTTNYWGGWDSIKILIMEKHEADRYGDGKDPSKHKVFIDHLGLCLWHVFLPGGFLLDDQEVDQLMGDHRYTIQSQW
ncbi:hypothetical protein PG997_014994 [Apiospora hydei]|uniref:2EXR domain-containing protein n=1 Tax=Apiospora hydei TaxID=1337664 RepID=A0ABR1UVF5_9PEZI